MDVWIIIALVAVATYGITHSIVAVLVVAIILALGVYIFGIWQGIPVGFPIHMVFDSEHAPSGWFGASTGSPVNAPEVFHIDGSYSYKEASNVCAVYDAQLATYDQIVEAYAKGAEWCSYGWSQSGLALYPVQESTWKSLQTEDNWKDRKTCGRPGINGGYFDTRTRFGVNCYGVKPDGDTNTYPIPIGTPKDISAIEALKKNKDSMKVAPWNRTGWSMWGV